MKILKKNQLALLVISLMLITAGYLNYDSTIRTSSNVNSVDLAKIGDAALVNANITDESTASEVVSNDDETSEVVQNTENTEETNAEVKDKNNEEADEYFATSKLERNVMYSQMIERYQKILENSGSQAEEKMIAQQEINDLNKQQNAIMIAENLLTTKGFKDNVIFVNKESINVIIGKDELSQNEIAQIQNIISRELGADVENIHISVK